MPTLPLSNPGPRVSPAASIKTSTITLTSLPFLILLAMTVRLVLASISIGSNNATTFHRFAVEIRESGLLQTYSSDSEFNHPPIPALWARFCLFVAGGNIYLFAFIFKLPPILCDCVCVYLLWKICKFNVARGLAGHAALLFALSPAAILVSAFHCNTDPCYAMLCLASVYLIECHASFFWAGVVLAAAINIKLIPVLLIPPLLLGCRDIRQAGRFVLGLSIGVIPFIPPMYANRVGFIHNVINYGSVIDRWGIPFFLMGRRRTFDPTSAAGHMALHYSVLGRALIPLATLAWALSARRVSRWNRYQICAITFAIFLIITPGFGMQYSAIVAPLLFAAAPAWAAAYALAAGVFLACGYYSFWDRSLPIYADYTDQLSVGVGIIGLCAWGILIGYVIRTLKTSILPGQARKTREAAISL